MSRRPTDLTYEDGRVASYESIRRYILNRHPLCQICEDAPSTEVDHIWPRYYGGDDRGINLQGVCSPCNKRKGNSVVIEDAANSKLYAASAALGERIVSLIEDMRRFDEELMVRAYGNGPGHTALEFLRYRASALSDLAALISGRAAVLTETYWTLYDRQEANA